MFLLSHYHFLHLWYVVDSSVSSFICKPNQMLKPFATVLFLFLNVTLFAATERQKEDPRPNVIVIMADDLGYGDLSCYGADSFKTPNIDKLAAGGVRFTNGYCSASTCTPTRYSLLTGTYAFRKSGTGIAPPNSPAVIAPDIFTLPDVMKRAGYRTAIVCKWQLVNDGEEATERNG